MFLFKLAHAITAPHRHIAITIYKNIMHIFALNTFCREIGYENKRIALLFPFWRFTKSQNSSRISFIPTGSRPFTGSSKIRSSGLCTIARAIASRWRIPSENVETACVPTFDKLTILRVSAIFPPFTSNIVKM